MRMDQWCVGVGGLSRLRAVVTSAGIDVITSRMPRVTVMKADSHLQIDPSTVCVIDAKSAFDHLVRESTGGHCRRTAQELCAIRRSMRTLRARCRWVTHERMVVDALTKRHGNSGTMLRLLRDGVLSIVDEDRELAMRKVYRETHKRNLRPRQQVEQAQMGEYDQRIAALTRSRPMRPVVAIID